MNNIVKLALICSASFPVVGILGLANMDASTLVQAILLCTIFMLTISNARREYPIGNKRVVHLFGPFYLQPKDVE